MNRLLIGSLVPLSAFAIQATTQYSYGGFGKAGGSGGGGASASNTASTVTVVEPEDTSQVVDVSYIEGLLDTCDQVFCDTPVHTCSFAHDRLKAGADNIYDIMQENKVWTDLGFIPSYSIQWNDYTNGLADDLMTSYADEEISFDRLQDLFPDIQLFGDNGPELNDIESSEFVHQASVLTSAAALVNKDPNIILNLFETKEVNNERVYEVKLYMNGMEHSITIDDYVLIETEHQIPVSAQVAQNTMWMTLLEKAFIKAIGNYETMLSLQPEEPIYWMTGKPVYSFDSQFKDGDVIWQQVEHFLDMGDVVTAHCEDTEITKCEDIGLVDGEIYNVLKTYILSSMGPPDYLFLMRQTYKDVTFSGKWNDNSDLWWMPYEQQVDFDQKDDQSFYITSDEYTEYIVKTTLGATNDNLLQSDSTGHVATGETQYFWFKLNNIQPQYGINVQRYPSKLYSPGCDEEEEADIKIDLFLESGVPINSNFAYDYSGSSGMYTDNLNAGIYQLEIVVNVPEGSDPSFSLQILANEEVQIYEGIYLPVDITPCQITQYTCTSAFDRMVDGPDNYETIIGSGEKYNDDSHPTCANLQWNYGWTSNSMDGFYDKYLEGDYIFSASYENQDVNSFKGSNGYSSDDIVQGYISDCYLLAGMSSLQENYPDLLEDIMLVDELNEEGIYAMALYAAGYRTVVTIDDLIFMNPLDHHNIFARISDDGAAWPSLLEKAVSKLYGNYERIANGDLHEGISWLTGFPGASNTVGTAFIEENIETLYWATQDHSFIVIAGSNGHDDTTTSANNIVQGHAYSVMRILPIYDEEGNFMTDLIKLRNPWGSELYTGPYSDSSSMWTDAIKEQVGDFEDSDDGSFYMDSETFGNEFKSLAINYYEDGMQANLFFVEDFEFEEEYQFMVELSEEQDVTSIAVNLVSPRQYSIGCDDQDTLVVMSFYSVDPDTMEQEYLKTIQKTSVTGIIQTTEYGLEAGMYKVVAQIYEGSNADMIKSFSLGVYTKEQVDIECLNDDVYNGTPAWYIAQ